MPTLHTSLVHRLAIGLSLLAGAALANDASFASATPQGRAVPPPMAVGPVMVEPEERGNPGGNALPALPGIVRRTVHRIDVDDIRMRFEGPITLQAAAPVDATAGAENPAPRITQDFKDIPVRTVLARIAEVAGLSFVAADAVRGNMSLRLINVPWPRALEVVLRQQGLDQRRRDKVIWIAPAVEIARSEGGCGTGCCAYPAPLVTEYIQIEHAEASEIAALIDSSTRQPTPSESIGGEPPQQRQTLLSLRGSVTFDQRTNTLLINDTLEKVAEIRRLVASLDRADETPESPVIP
jgi:hypothetical protein